MERMPFLILLELILLELLSMLQLKRNINGVWQDVQMLYNGEIIENGKYFKHTESSITDS